MQNDDVDEAKSLQSGENVLQLFLIQKSRVKSIDLFSKRLDHDSARTNVEALEIKIKNRRIKSSTGNTSHYLSMSVSHKQRSKIGLRNNKKKSIKINTKKDLKILEKSSLMLQKNHSFPC